ncbi:hypothetical protein BGZ83_007724 [Gryganskiella cystojenkinii]|nr:hypothetical protein BGZ83_007724 [Gryganskiella cystojenkinii]
MPTSALLVMDVQQLTVARVPDTDYLPRLRTAIDAARATGIPVIYVVISFRDGYPEVSGRNKCFSAIAQTGALINGDAGLQIHPDVAPLPGEVIVTKRRISAFTGSDLDVVLRGLGVDHLVLAGIATSGVVLSTLTQAADLDFALTVLADGCLDTNPDVHRVLMEKVFPRSADILTIEEWAKTTSD